MKRLLLAFLLAAGFGSAAFAAVSQNSWVSVQKPNIGAQTFIAGTDTAGTFKTVYTGAADGSKCTGFYAVSDDASLSHLLTVRIVHSSTNFPTMATTINASGNGANNYGTPLNLFAPGIWPGLPVDENQNPYLFLTNGDTLQITFATALTATDQIDVLAVCADF